MSKRILVNASYSGELRIATVEGGTLEDFNVESTHTPHLKGNIYKCTVSSAKPGSGHIFVEYETGKSGFLPAGSVKVCPADVDGQDLRAVLASRVPDVLGLPGYVCGGPTEHRPQ